MGFKLIERAYHEAESQIEVSLKEAFDLLESQLRPPFPLRFPTQEDYLSLNKAILYGILCEPLCAKVHLKHLHAKIADGYGYFINLLVKIVNELYSKLVDSAKIQLLWVVKEMVFVSGIGVDAVIVALLRQIVSYDVSDGNLWLCSEMVDLFLGNWECLVEEEPLLLTSALYVFLRVLADHCRITKCSKIETLRQKEIHFSVKLLRENFALSVKLGRDLVRLLQDLVHVPEFRDIWKDLLIRPHEFKVDGCGDISQVYQLVTPSHYFLLRITPEMEKQLRFLLTRVKFGNQKRYQVWFARKFLNAPEKETLIVDIVRFICCAHYQSNEVINSGILPRWAVIGWLLKCCRKKYVEANVKLALLYDWLFFNEEVDTVLNVEPAISLMINSIPKYVDMTHALLDFLFILMDNYDLDRREKVVNGVSRALATLLGKGMVSSIDALTNCDMISPYFREKLGNLLADVQGYKLHSAKFPVDVSVCSFDLPSSTPS